MGWNNRLRGNCSLLDTTDPIPVVAMASLCKIYENLFLVLEVELSLLKQSSSISKVSLFLMSNF